MARWFLTFTFATSKKLTKSRAEKFFFKRKTNPLEEENGKGNKTYFWMLENIWASSN